MADARKLFPLVRAMLCAGFLLAGAPYATAEPLKPEVKWKDPSSVDLEVDFPGNGYHASWELFRCDCGDLMIRSELNLPGEVVHGDILLVGKRAVLVRGYDADSAEQISFDAPALMMQLTLALLERAAPAGPSGVTEREEVLIEDSSNYINLDSGGAVGGFPPPWSATGAIWPQGESERRFDLNFHFNAGGAGGSPEQEGEMRLSGVADYAAGEFPLSPDTDLSEWDLSWRDQDDSAAGAAKNADTLAELRALLKSEPGV